MYNKSGDVFGVVASVFGGPTKKGISNWINKINSNEYIESVKNNSKVRKNKLNNYDRLLRDAFLIFVENYKNIIKEIIEDDEKISDYYTSKKHISKLKKYYNKNIFNINENKEIELTNYQHSSINYLSDNRDKNIVILLPTGFGKTIISFYEIINYVKEGHNIIFSAPTKVLVEQQYNDFVLFLHSIDRADIIELLEHQKTSKKIGEETQIVFTTNHKAKDLCELDFLQKDDLMIIDEIHIGEGKKEKDNEYLYPIYQSADILKKNEVRIVGLTATTIHKDALIDKLGIDEFFYAGKKEYFIPKNRHLISVQKNSSYNEIENNLNEEILRKSSVLRRFLITHNFSKQQILMFSDNEILNNNYFDLNNNPLIKKLIKKIKDIEFKSKKEKFYFKLVFKIAKLIELKKILTKHNYISLMETLSNYYIESKEKNIKYKKDLRGYFFLLFDKLYKLVVNGQIHPKEEKLWEILKLNKKQNKPTIVYVNDFKTIKWLLVQAQINNLNASYLHSAKNNSEKMINDYSINSIMNGKLDVVFMTSVGKLGINFDINEFIFYHSPDNEKDLLQFEGRVGRYSRDNNIYYLFGENTFESPYAKIKKSDKLLNEMFAQAAIINEKNTINSLYSKGGNNFDIDKNKSELNSFNIFFGVDSNNNKLNKNQIIHSRFLLKNQQILHKKSDRKPYLKIEATDAFGYNCELLIFGFNIESQIRLFIEKYDIKNENIYDLKANFSSDNVMIINIDSAHNGLQKLYKKDYNIDDYVGIKTTKQDLFSGDDIIKAKADKKNKEQIIIQDEFDFS